MSIAALALVLTSIPRVSGAAALIVVRDLGGASALPYYEALHLHAQVIAPSMKPAPRNSSGVQGYTMPERHFRESDLLPVRSMHLTPGAVAPRTLHLPGLTPLFLIGTDTDSQRWLREHAQKLRALNAIGFVVNVESMEALDSLRRQTPSLTVSPASGDELARRLHLNHYPVLITATGIEP